jgi:hypothetical protein
MLQTLIVALLVTACAGYAAWTLMPGAARRALAVAMLKLPLPTSVATRLREAARASSGCGCDGCDHAPAKAAGTANTVTFHPRRRH